MAAYAEALGDLSDAAWLGACRIALRSCKYFPVPAELLEFAEAAAEEATQKRVIALNGGRFQQAETDAARLLTAGVVTEEQAAENRKKLDAMFAETVAAIRAGGNKVKAERNQEMRDGRRRRRVLP